MTQPQQRSARRRGFTARAPEWLAPYGLPLKIALPTLALVFVLSIVSAVVLGWFLEDVHTHEAQTKAERFASFVESELRVETAAGHREMLPVLGAFCRAANERSFVTDARGRVRFACVPEMIGERVAPQPGLAGETVVRGGEKWFRLVRPARGGARCASCHGSQDPVGWIGIDLPLGKADAEVREQQRMNLIVGTISMSAIGVLLVLVQVVLVYRPVSRLTVAVDRIRAGDLATRLPAPPPDELGRLAHSVNEMAASLEDAKAELKRTHRAELAQSEKLAALGQVFTTVSHEIKNELAGIIGALREVEQDVPASDANKPMLAKILAQMERMSRTSVAALDFARPLSVPSESVDLADLLDRTLFFIERQAAEQHVELRKSYARDLPRAAVDEDLMKEVFLNILLNGVQAMPTGGVLEVKTRAAGDRAVEVVISDEGSGIAPEHREQIFAPFFTTKARGTGLGLYVARKIVQAQQGDISLAARPGRGTAFTVRLPSDRVTEKAGTDAAR